jgi:hypothetical protein
MSKGPGCFGLIGAALVVGAWLLIRPQRERRA